jgi:hypothetical protein
LSSGRLPHGAVKHLMRASAKSVLLLLLISLVSIPGAAQHPDLRYNAGAVHTLTREEGLAVLGAALDFRHYRGSESDCSHFVHVLYQRAGFPYAYAPSSELYSGIDQFQRVTTPQAGDLAVWRGHAGIVVNPVQHSFFSLLRSGAGVESYDSPYWRRRGLPRFFRYVKGNPGVGLATSLRSASLKPTAGEDADSEHAVDDPNRSQQFSNEGRPSTRLADTKPASPVIPQIVVLNSPHPTPDQLRTAFLQSCVDSGESLGGRDLFTDQSLVIFDHFIVRKLHISETQGWAEVEIDELVSVSAGRSEVHGHSERQRWPFIRRAQATWELSLPQRTIYLPQDIAAHIAAQQLAQLTRDSASNSDKAEKIELAQLLNALLQK